MIRCRTLQMAPGLVTALAVLGAASAQEKKEPEQTPFGDKKGFDKKKFFEGKKGFEGKKDAKPSPELEKAQAQLKDAEAEMQKLREQMQATMKKLMGAQAEVAKLGGEVKKAPFGGVAGPGGGFGNFGALRRKVRRLAPRGLKAASRAASANPGLAGLRAAASGAVKVGALVVRRAVMAPAPGRVAAKAARLMLTAGSTASSASLTSLAASFVAVVDVCISACGLADTRLAAARLRFR